MSGLLVSTLRAVLVEVGRFQDSNVVFAVTHSSLLHALRPLQAIKLGFNDTRCVLEPAGALAIAGMRKYLRDKGLVGHSVRKGRARQYDCERRDICWLMS